MKVDTRRIASFLHDPGSCRVVLLFGDDAGLIRERSNSLVRAVAGRIDDPFRVVELPRNAIASLHDEASSVALGGGRRVILVREVSESALAQVRMALDSASDSLTILESATLPARSKLRGLLESHARGAAIACYPSEGLALEQAVGQAAADLRVQLDGNALKWFCSHLAGDRAVIKSELEKLALFASPGSTIGLETAMTCLAVSAEVSIDEALLAATNADLADFDRALELSIQGGSAPASILRAAVGHLHRLLRVRQAADNGVPVEQAIAELRPPVFWKHQAAFINAVATLDQRFIGDTLLALDGAERRCRQTGAPTEVICRAALHTLSRSVVRNRRVNRSGAG